MPRELDRQKNSRGSDDQRGLYGKYVFNCVLQDKIIKLLVQERECF